MIWVVRCPECGGSVRADLAADERMAHAHTTGTGAEHAHSAQWWVEIVPREFA